MDHYEIKANTHCEVFSGYGDEIDTLRAIAAWWENIEGSKNTPTIEVIKFYWLEREFRAEVFWLDLTEGQEKAVEKAMNEPQLLQVESVSLSNN